MQGRVDIVSYTTFVPSGHLGCSTLRGLRKSGSHKGLGWPGYVQAALKKYAGHYLHADALLLPTPCSNLGEYTVKHNDLGVDLNIIEFKVWPVKGATFNVDWNRVIDYLKNSRDEVVLYIHDLFSPGFAFDLLNLLPRIKGLKSVIGIIAHQHAKPPFKYYGEIPVSRVLRALAPLLERLFRVRLDLIDGFIVINKKTYKYLVGELEVSPERVVYQHVGIDYEKVNPQNVEADDDFWGNCEYRLIMSSLVTKKYGGTVRGVDLVPQIAEELQRLGYKPCIVIAGEVLDPDLANSLKSGSVVLTGFLPRQKFYSILAAADIYILPARKSYYYARHRSCNDRSHGPQ